jgi:hypothetical protein
MVSNVAPTPTCPGDVSMTLATLRSRLSGSRTKPKTSALRFTTTLSERRIGIPVLGASRGLVIRRHGARVTDWSWALAMPACGV